MFKSVFWGGGEETGDALKLIVFCGRHGKIPYRRQPRPFASCLPADVGTETVQVQQKAHSLFLLPPSTREVSGCRVSKRRLIGREEGENV